MEKKCILELKGIGKTFPGVKALDDVSVKFNAGEVHAIVGENGAGKSTLMKVLSAVYPAGTYDGEIVLEGEPVKFAGIRESEHAGIQIIYQELALCKLMSIAENVYLGNEIASGAGVINKDETIIRTRKYLKEVGLDFDPTTPVINLGIGQQQLVEIAKAISKKAKILILDEPTAPLTEKESQNLLEIVQKIKESGVACIFISHKLDEVFRVSDQITVMRDGKVISTAPTSEYTMEMLITQMVGREMGEMYPKENHEQGEVVLQVKNWSVTDPQLPTRKLVKDASFEVRRGEVLGIAGLVGAGRTELALSIFGCYKGFTEGELVLDGKLVTIKEPRDAIGRGIAYLTEDRKRYGLNLEMNLQDNISLACLEKISKFGIIDNDQKIVSAQKMIDSMHIKTPSSEQLAKNLSGGNQQKVVIGKWLMVEPKIIFMDEPTRGIDVGAKYEIYKIINQLVDNGVCVVMISSELPEILGMSDRILVVSEGQIKAELDNRRSELTQEQVMYHCVGGK